MCVTVVSVGEVSDEAVRAILRARRSALDISVNELAARSGMSERTLARYLHGDSRLVFASVVKIADGLGTTVQSIADEAERWVQEQKGTGGVE
jgi:transcriptional regulator with XRE-family HTH domain